MYLHKGISHRPLFAETFLLFLHLGIGRVVKETTQYHHHHHNYMLLFLTALLRFDIRYKFRIFNLVSFDTWTHP